MAGNGSSAAAIAAVDPGGFHPQPPQPANLPIRQNRWAACFSGFSCFGSQKGGKRIVPAARVAEGSSAAIHGNGIQPVGAANQNVALNLSLLAPPSSPASFTHSALPSTAQSPNNFLSVSASSPGGPSMTMFATGPYAHETQLVSPPVFSTYTTEPSTAPLTPPPELAHATTPSSPDVPFAKFLSSSAGLRSAGKQHNYLSSSSSYGMGSGHQSSYPPGSPSSSLISPASATPRTGMSSPFPEPADFPKQWKASRSAQDSPYFRNSPTNLFGVQSAHSNFMMDSSFFCPASSAQFYLDQAQESYPYSGRRPSNAVESDKISNPNRHNTNCKQDVEEVEAYRASFGFSADEIIASQHHAETSDGVDESFTISPFGSSYLPADNQNFGHFNENQELDRQPLAGETGATPQVAIEQFTAEHKVLHNLTILTGHRVDNEPDDAAGTRRAAHPFLKTELALRRNADTKRHYHSGQSISDAEIEYRRVDIDYRRARSVREASSNLSRFSSFR